MQSGYFTKYGPAYSFVKEEDSREVHFGGVAANKRDLSLQGVLQMMQYNDTKDLIQP